jgi:putative phosphoribosyl transferase
MLFKNRTEAGRQLAGALAEYAHRPGVLVLALPRGGVPVAFELASALASPLDVFVVRKLGVPGHPELAMGAIATGGIQVLNHDVLEALRIPPARVEEAAGREQLELARRDRLYRGNRPPPVINSRIVILVDDGLATGSTMEAAIAAVRHHRPDRLIVAVPVGARETCARLRPLVEALICLRSPEPFQAVGLWYEEFGQTSDEEVRTLLDAGGHPAHAVAATLDRPPR